MTERRVLVLAYFFPPLGGAGVQRTLKFVRYLPGHGWHPTVVTTDSRAYPVSDDSLLDEVPQCVRVVRARELRLIRWLLDRASVALELVGLRRWLPLGVWPDDATAWAPSALWHALRIAHRDRPAVIFSTSAPFTAHFVAMTAHRLTGIPWVADFRDEWSTNPHLAAQGRMVARLSRWAEGVFFRRAARVVTVADYFEMAPAAAGQRVTIANGVDPEDVAALPPPKPPSDRFVLAYVGTLYGPRDAAPVVGALRRLVDRGAIEPARFELRVVGNIWLEAQRWPVQTSVTGYLPHRAAMTEMTTATALLLYVPPGSLAPGGKLYEYLASGRPILAVAPPENLASRLVDTWGAGRTAAPDDVDAVEAALLALYREWKRGRLGIVDDVRERALRLYGRDRLTADLARVLDEAATTR